MPFPFYDRDEELAALAEYARQVREDCSRLVVVTGRRRIGKTALVNHAFMGGDLPYYFLFVNAGDDEKGNVQRFLARYSEALGFEGFLPNISSFESLFEFLLKRSAASPMVVMVDEFQNCASVAPAFFGALQRLWDSWRKKSRMLLILTGSVASAMREIVENPSAPLFGRQSAQMRIQPFSTSVVSRIFRDYAPQGSPDDLLTLYAVTGGVPKYLEVMMESGAVTREGILRTAFGFGSYFENEASALFLTEFKSEYALYFRILKAIAGGKTKRSELVSQFSPQDISGHLYRLENYYRLISREYPVGIEKSTQFRFRIPDRYILFWFRFIYPNAGLIEQMASGELIGNVLAQLPDYTGMKVLAGWFRAKLSETGHYSKVGAWWDRKGENEIDIVAVNDFEKEILFAEVKRQKKNIDLGALQEKVYAFMGSVKLYRQYRPILKGWSLEDM